MMTYSQTRRHIQQQLADSYSEREAQWVARIVMEHVTGKTDVDMLIHADDEMYEYDLQRVQKILEQLRAGQPVQYAIGEAWFYGMRLKVAPSTLIPRPETAELVDMIVDDAKGRSDLRVLDVGTGSGCIALALARHLPFADVSAIDISAEALAIARENAASLKASVNFIHEDVFKFSPEAGSFDIIVSNPPYIMDSERGVMESHVLDYEPHQALFVPDSDPIRFYTAISRLAFDALREGGRLYFELNPLTAIDVAEYVKHLGFKDVRVSLDSQGRKRFLSATR